MEGLSKKIRTAPQIEGFQRFFVRFGAFFAEKGCPDYLFGQPLLSYRESSKRGRFTRHILIVEQQRVDALVGLIH